MEDSLLRNRIVHGIMRESVRKRLLSKKDLTLEKCVELCRVNAKITSQAQTMRRVSNPKPSVDDELQVVRSSSRGAATRGTPAANAHKNAPSARKNRSDNAPCDSTSGPRRIDCHYCDLNHIYGRKHCSAVGNKCSSCGGVDHFSRVCRKRLRRRDQVQQIEEADEDDEDDVEEQLLVTTDLEQNSINALGDDTASFAFPKKLIATVDVNGHSVRFQLDSGANCDIIRECDLPPDTPVTTTTRTPLLYDRSKVAPVGECSLRVRRPNTPTWFRGSFLVVRDAPLSILGSSSSQRLGYIEVRREYFCITPTLPRGTTPRTLCLRTFFSIVFLQSLPTLSERFRAFNI